MKHKWATLVTISRFTLLPLRAVYFRSFLYETPCRSRQLYSTPYIYRLGSTIFLSGIFWLYDCHGQWNEDADQVGWQIFYQIYMWTKESIFQNRDNYFFSGSRSTDLRYRIGLAIGYGVPFFISFLTGIVEATAPRCSSIKPRFIEGSCFFSSKSMGTISTYLIWLNSSACGRVSSVQAWQVGGTDS